MPNRNVISNEQVAAAILGEFRKWDSKGRGAIGRHELGIALQTLSGGAISKHQYDDMLVAAGFTDQFVQYEELISWLFEDQNRINWGDWMGAWKATEGLADIEQDRLSRMNAAFGGETMARIKDINVLVIGCRGVGIETAKNLILSNVGSITIWDPASVQIEDCGANFYLSSNSVGKPRASECLSSLKSLNPYCKVEALNLDETLLCRHLDVENVLSTGQGYSAVVVTEIMSRNSIAKLNEKARKRNIAFILGFTSGVTTTMFSDFGCRHKVTDEDGEPTQMLAISAVDIVEVSGIIKIHGAAIGDKVLVLTLASDHSLQDGDTISLDDIRGDRLAGYNGKVFKVKRFSVISPTDAKVDLKDVAMKEMLTKPTCDVVRNYAKQYEHYRGLFEAAGTEGRFRQREITLFNRLCLMLNDGMSVDDWSSYQSGGLVNSVKSVQIKEHKNFEHTLVYTPNPQMLDQEAWHAGEGCWVHLALNAALAFHEAKGRWPRIRSQNDARDFVSIAKTISDQHRPFEGACWLQKVEWGFPCGDPVDNMDTIEHKLQRFSLLFGTELTGLCAFVGGAVAQEVIKKTGKFTPIDQWVHHDDACLATCGADPGPFATTRYAHQATVLGAGFMEAIQNQRIFLVGCGALGCEYLKGLALMGCCTAPGAKLTITDMDRIEVSNLSRQFLFRQSDVGSPKSTTAARVVTSWNPEMQVEALEKGVGITSEDYFDNKFWSQLDLCWNALDNVVARKYTDRCCLWYGLPLLESGTLGTKSNSDVFLPHLTKSYNDGTESDTNENQIAMCTLRSFPYLPLHCIEFAKQAYFSDYLEFAPQQYESFRKDRSSFFEQLSSMSEAEQLKSLNMIKEFIDLHADGKIDFVICIKAAFRHYCRDFVKSIKDLVHTCDEIERSTGKPFWTGTKRKPAAAKWHSQQPPAYAMEYLYACANCYAFMWKVPYVRSRREFNNIVIGLSLEAPSWTPPTKVDMNVASQEGDGINADDSVQIEKLMGELYEFSVDGLQPCLSHDFEKDDDTNFHVDFLTAAANLRANNYDIKQSERSQVKVTAGKIIPALATTTAMVCGLVDVEFMKIVLGLHRHEGALDKFYNANVNLATGLMAMNVFRPEPAVKRQSKIAAIADFTSWDKFDIAGEITLKELVEQLQHRLDIKVQRLFPVGNDKICIYDSTHEKKMGWRIELNDDGSIMVDPEEVFSAWPQLRMAVQMLQRLPPGGARNNFETQLRSASKSLQCIKDSFRSRYNGPASLAYVAAARPPQDDAEKQRYFDTVFERHPCIALDVHALNSKGEEAQLPVIRYTFRS